MLNGLKLYNWLNPLFGTPQKIEPGSYTRLTDIFEASTKAFLEGQLEHIAGKRVLVVGVGDGAEVLWLANHANELLAIDVDDNLITGLREKLGPDSHVVCHTLDQKIPADEKSFDTIFMHNVCEHIIDLDHWFAEYHRVLKDEGTFINDFCPLFYSPYGAHLQDAYKLPWGHLMFSPQTMAKVRNQYYPGDLKAENWADFGLNRITEGQYRKLLKRIGFEPVRYKVRTSKNLPLAWVPGLRNLFIIAVESTLKKA